MRLPTVTVPLALFLLQSGCAPKSDSTSFVCGLTSLSAPLAVQQGLASGQALSEAPWNPPDTIPVRVVAGPLFHGSVSHDTTVKTLGGTPWNVILVDSLPTDSRIGHGVLVVDGRGNNHGVLLFEGPVVSGAAQIGTVKMAAKVLPLIGVRMSSQALKDTDCPLFKTKAE